MELMGLGLWLSQPVSLELVGFEVCGFLARFSVGSGYCGHGPYCSNVYHFWCLWFRFASEVLTCGRRADYSPQLVVAVSLAQHCVRQGNLDCGICGWVIT